MNRTVRSVAFGMLIVSAPVVAGPASAIGLAASEPEVSAHPATLALPSPTNPSGLVDPDAYVVGPGDVFTLVFSGRVSRSQVTPVNPEGSVLIPGWTPIRVAGLTLREARARVKSLLGRDLSGVDVDFQLERVRFIRVELAGAVRNAQPVVVPATSRVTDALPDSMLRWGASHRRIEVRRKDGTIVLADLDLYLLTGRLEANPYLRDGDVLFVPVGKEFIEIYGAVARSAQFELGTEDSLHTLLDLAGGLLPSARLDRALMVTWRTPTQIDSIWFRPDSVAARVTDPALANGDRVYVMFIPAFHELEQAVTIGEFGHPGVYPLEAGRTRLSDLVRAAGGFSPRADISSIRLTRSEVNTGDARTDPDYLRLSRISRGEMTGTEFDRYRASLAVRRREYRIDWARVQKEHGLDLLLAAGDSLRADPLLASVRVDGQVVHPGVIDFKAGWSVHDYIQTAGGFTSRAGGRVAVTRAGSGQTVPGEDVNAIAPGDLIWVADRSDKTPLEHLLPVLMVAAQIATIVLAFRR